MKNNFKIDVAIVVAWLILAMLSFTITAAVIKIALCILSLAVVVSYMKSTEKGAAVVYKIKALIWPYWLMLKTSLQSKFKK